MFHEVWWIHFANWGSFIGFHICRSPISTSLACLFTLWSSNLVERERWQLRCHLVSPTLCILLYGKWIWTNYPETSREQFIRTTTNNCRIIFLAHTNTVILLEHIFFLLALRFWSKLKNDLNISLSVDHLMLKHQVTIIFILTSGNNSNAIIYFWNKRIWCSPQHALFLL